MIPTTSPTTLDRIMLYLRQLIRAELPRLSFVGFYEYAVQSVVSDSAYAIVPTDPSLSLPGSGNVPLRLSCATATLPKGSLVLISFVNGDPSRPFIVSGAPTPTNQTIDASTTLTLGPSAGLVNIAGGADAGALATAVQNAVTALNTFDIAVTSYAAALTAAANANPALYVPFALAVVAAGTPMATAGGTLSAAIAALIAAIPATKTRIT